MGLDDITKKARNFLDDNKVKETLTSQQAEDISDKLLASAADAANKVTGGKHEDKIEGARKAADDKIGND